MILFILLLSSCTDEDSGIPAPPTSEIPLSIELTSEWTGWYSSWWSIPQSYNKVPKYSGAFGTYTHKHIPVAINSQGDLFSVRTDNSEDDNFYVYVMKNNTEVKVHTIKNWNDPHTNAAINIDEQGYVWVHIASRGLAHKFQSGKVLKSNTPFELDFQCVDGCNNVNYEAYPQIHNAFGVQYLIYTRYEASDTGISSRRRTYSKVQGNHFKLSKLSHYNVSHFDEETNRLCVASNTLVNGSPDNRVNLSFICTEDTSGEWYTLDERVNFDKEDETNRIVFNSEGKFVYLKDIISYKGLFRVMFTLSNTDDPTSGSRELCEWVEGSSVQCITSVGHNYSAGAYTIKDGELFLVVGRSAVEYYLSGSLDLYKVKGSSYHLESTLSDNEYSYIRRVRNEEGSFVGSVGQSDLQRRGEHYLLKVQSGLK